MKLSLPAIDENLVGFLHKLNGLDFGPLAYKLMHPEDRPGLSLEQAQDAITKYKGFLFLCRANPEKAVSPSRYIDYVWHTHILDTEVYFAQTAILYGHYLHHFPFFGQRDAGDEKDLQAAAEYTINQAHIYFDWDDDEWCGTGRKPKWPGPPAAELAVLARILSPLEFEAAAPAHTDSFAIQSGNFKHTVQYFGSPFDPVVSLQSSYYAFLWAILKKLPRVTVCKPVDYGLLNQSAVTIPESRLQEITKSLIGQRLVPEGYQAGRTELLMRV